jgi:hypothetical protein
MLRELYTRLEKSDVFKSFKAQNPDAFLCAGFFILNYKQNNRKYAFDFRNDKQLFTFDFPENEQAHIILKIDELLPSPKPLDKIHIDVQVDIEDLEEIIKAGLRDNNIKNQLEEIIAVLQNIDNQIVWNLTCMCEGMVVINALVHSETSGILKFEKKNLLDFIKKPGEK